MFLKICFCGARRAPFGARRGLAGWTIGQMIDPPATLRFHCVGRGSNYRDFALACSARAAPIAVFTCFFSSGGGRTACMPSNSKVSTKPGQLQLQVAMSKVGCVAVLVRTLACPRSARQATVFGVANSTQHQSAASRVCCLNLVRPLSAVTTIRFGSVPPVRHHDKLTLAPLAASVAAAVY